MQKTHATYRERLTPSLWLIVAAAAVGPMAGLVFAPFDSTLALIAGASVSALVVALLIVLAPRIEIRDGWLRAGRAHIDVRWVDSVTAFSGDAARHARGPGLDARAWMLLRGSLDGVVRIGIADPGDPIRAWVLSTRTPDRLAAAVESERAYAAQSLQMSPTELSPES